MSTSVDESDNGYVSHGSMDGPELAPFPPYVQTLEAQRRWLICYRIAEATSAMYEESGNPDPRFVWITTRALYNSDTPTGAGDLVEASDAQLELNADSQRAKERARAGVNQALQARPSTGAAADQWARYTHLLLDALDDSLGPVHALVPDYFTRELAEAMSVAAITPGHFDANLHPRTRAGQWASKLGDLVHGVGQLHEKSRGAGLAATMKVVSPEHLAKLHSALTAEVPHATLEDLRNVRQNQPADHARLAGKSAVHGWVALEGDVRDHAGMTYSPQAVQDAEEIAKRTQEMSVWASEHSDLIHHASQLLHVVAQQAIPGLTAADDSPVEGRELEEEAKVGGAMIALYPEPDAARQLAVDGGEDPGKLHITLKFLGDDHEDLSDELKGKINYALEQFAKNEAPLEGETDGVGSFDANPNWKPDEKPVFAKPDVDGLHEFRRRLVDALPDGVMEDTHPTFKPHLTLKYVPADAEGTAGVAAKKVPLRFGEVHAVYGGDRVSFPLQG